MVWVAGADGCKAGWFRACQEVKTGALRFDVVRRAAELLDRPPCPAVLALDIPIGLPEAGPRACDQLARRRLGPRRSSVFPAPIRPALQAKDRQAASQITLSRDGRKVGAQAWALTAKIREVDALLQARPADRMRVRESHPEVSFWSLAGGRPMAAAKKTPEGTAERHALITAWLDPESLSAARGRHSKSALADDDILDACALLWTAHRILRGEAERLPARPPRDATGLAMEIVV